MVQLRAVIFVTCPEVIDAADMLEEEIWILSTDFNFVQSPVRMAHFSGDEGKIVLMVMLQLVTEAADIEQSEKHDHDEEVVVRNLTKFGLIIMPFGRNTFFHLLLSLIDAWRHTRLVGL